MKENFLVSCRPDMLREEKVGSVSRSEQNFLELAAAVLFEVDLLFGKGGSHLNTARLLCFLQCPRGPLLSEVHTLETWHSAKKPWNLTMSYCNFLAIHEERKLSKMIQKLLMT